MRAALLKYSITVVLPSFGFQRKGEWKRTSSANASAKTCSFFSLTNWCHFARPSTLVFIEYVLLSLSHEGTPTVLLRNNKTMDLFVHTDNDTSERERILNT